MIIDLRTEIADFKEYISKRIDNHVGKGKPKAGMLHVGFTFDQDGWVYAYFDTRPNSSRDGEWTTHIEPETILPRPLWHEASELSNLGDLCLIDPNGDVVQSWSTHPTLKKLADILGEFLRSAVSNFYTEGLFQPLLRTDKLSYCVEEFTGLYGWPTDPEIAKIVESLKLSGQDSNSHVI